MLRKGQISVEYLLVVAVIILVILFLTRPNGDMQNGLNNVMQQQAQDINRMADKIFN